MSYSFRQNISFEQGGKQDFQHYKFVIEIYVQLLFKKKKKKKNRRKCRCIAAKSRKYEVAIYPIKRTCTISDITEIILHLLYYYF